MSQTMSSPSDWGQFYQQNVSNQVPEGVFTDRVSDSTVVTTTITSPATSVPFNSGNSSSNSGHLSPEGRVSKPIRRRSRASRRTPTTLLNTDTTNFRAMVQQFTGGPTAPFASGSQLNPQSFSFGFGPRQAHVGPSAVMVPAAGYHLQYQPQHRQQYQQQQHQSQPPYMFSLGNNSNPTDHNLFFQRLGNPRPASMEGSDGFAMEGVSSQVGPSRPPPSASNENRSNSFLF